jgi:hypothetical protein
MPASRDGPDTNEEVFHDDPVEWAAGRRLGDCCVGAGGRSLGSGCGPDTIAAPGETVVATMHAEGAQVYECKADAGGRLVWQFRVPVATLLLDGKTVGRHYAGPNTNASLTGPEELSER